MLDNYAWDAQNLEWAADSLEAATTQLQYDYNHNVPQSQLDTDVNIYDGAYGMYQNWVAVIDSDLNAMHEAHCM